MQIKKIGWQYGNGSRLLIAAGVVATIGLVLLAGCRRGGHERISLRGELEALTTPAAFAQPPRGTSAMLATFDRQGGNRDWWVIPPPYDGKELYEAALLEGPGCVKRLWMTNVPAKEWLFFFDGEDTPRLRLPQEQLFGLRQEFSPLCGSLSGGSYVYLPFPYAKSLRIVLRIPKLRPNERPYFHINYERYPNGTPIESWSVEAEAAASNNIVRCTAAWQQSAEDATAALARVVWSRHELPPGGTAVFFDGQGPGIIRSVAVRPAGGPWDAIRRALLLRVLVLEAYWEDAETPSIQVPLGDFFCNGLHPREFAALPMANVGGTHLCRLPMPFRRRARLVLRNEGPFAVTLDTGVDLDSVSVSDELYLHAAFGQSLPKGRPFQILRTQGRGKYVGCYLVALGMDGSWNILEGDESFYRDDAVGPVHHGTGLEDYFNGGWYYYGLFERPLHGLLEKAAMRTAQYRFHLSDPVTFNKSLRMQIEFGDANQAGGYLSAAAFWYQEKPGPAGSTLPAPTERYPALDQIGLAAIPCELFELERLGLIADAQARCEFYAGVLKQEPVGWTYHLRALAYRELLEGHAAVREDYLALAARTNLPPQVVQEAQLLAWRGEKPGRVIFGAHAFGDCRLFVDGRLIGATQHPLRWAAWPVELSPGEHLLEAEVVPRHTQAFVSIGVSAFFTNIVSDASWDYRLLEGEEAAESSWMPYASVPGFFPTMSWWQFEPNAFPCVQSGLQQGGPCAGWADPPGRTYRLRRRVIVPLEGGDRPPLPARLYDLPSQAVRPKDDTSNEM